MPIALQSNLSRSSLLARLDGVVRSPLRQALMEQVAQHSQP